MIDYTEELELAVQSARSTMPEGLQRLINIANFDLYFGPVEPTDDYENDGFRWPGFCAAADRIQEWADDVSNWQLRAVVFETNDDGEEVEVEEVIGSIEAADILRKVLGKELYSTIYR